MKKALISKVEPCKTGYRVADVHETGFEVHSNLFWVDCEDNVVADHFWYDPESQTIKPVHLEPEPEQPGE